MHSSSRRRRLVTLLPAVCLLAVAGYAAGAAAPPVIHPSLVRITADFGTEQVTGTAQDTTVTLAGVTYRLSQLQSVSLRPTVRARTSDGKFVRGELKGLDAVRVDVSGAVGPVDLSKADAIRISPIILQADATTRPLRPLPVVPLPPAPPAAVPPAAVGTPSAPATSRQPPGEMAISSEIPLPCPVFDAVTAVDGKYLVLLLRKANQLAVYDFEQSRIVKYLPIPRSPVVIAAGLDKLLVLVNKERSIEKWDLQTFAREKVAPLVLPGRALAAAMGPAAKGPVLVLWQPRLPSEPFPFDLIDTETLQVLHRQPDDSLTGVLFVPTRTLLRASRHQEFFVITTDDGPYSGVLRLNGSSVFFHRIKQPFPGYLAPGPDALTLFRGAHGLTNADDGETLAGAPAVIPGTQDVGKCIPASVPGIYLNLCFAPAHLSPIGTQSQELFVYLQGRRRPALPLPRLGEFPFYPGPQFDTDAMALDKRVFFRPDLKKIITLPANRNSIVVHELDVFEQLKHSGDDQYLLVSSIPPPVARVGQIFRYPIQVQSAVGGVSFEWVSGPAGWSVSNTGVVSGRISGGEKTPPRIVIRIKDKESNEFTYGFSVLPRP